MNKRQFILSGISLAALPVLAEDNYSTEEYLLTTLQRMEVGDTITVTKVGHNTWRLLGDNLPDRK